MNTCEINEANPQPLHLDKLFSEKAVLPLDIITVILGALDLSTLTKLNFVNRNWNDQVSHFCPPEYLNNFSHLPRWIGISSRCAREVFDVYRVKEEKNRHQILLESFNIDLNVENFEVDGVYDNQRLMTRLNKLYGELNYHLFLGWTNTDDYSSHLEEMSHDLCGDIYYTENFKGNELELSDTSQTLPPVFFKLIFDNISCYRQWISFNKTGQSGLILRLKKLEIVSSETAEKKLKDVALLFNQIIQQWNQREDEEFFDSLDEVIDPVNFNKHLA